MTVEPAEEPQVLAPGEVVVHRRVLAGEAYPFPHLGRVAQHVEREGHTQQNVERVGQQQDGDTYPNNRPSMCQ